MIAYIHQSDAMTIQIGWWKERWKGTSATLEEDLRQVPDEKLWAMRAANREAPVSYCFLRGEPSAAVSSSSRHHRQKEGLPVR